MKPAKEAEKSPFPECGQSLPKVVNKSGISCDFCGKTFKFQTTLRQHEIIHYGIKQHECELCHHRFLHKSTLKCHLRMHTGEKPYKCPHCPKTFRGQTALNCHIFRHTNEGAKCPVCSKVFATSSIVKQHLKQVHTTERSNVCNLCGVTYKHLKSLRMHLRNHQKRVCPECDAEFDSVYAMLKHRKQSHMKENLPFKCEHCDRTFEHRSKLASHTNLRGRPFQCELCCHSFNKQEFLTNHERRIHWKEMGLERLKVAEPLNGWNRKGIPKPKRTKTSSKPIQTKDLNSDNGLIAEREKQNDSCDGKDVLTMRVKEDMSTIKEEPAIVSDPLEPETTGEYHEYIFKPEQPCSKAMAQQEDFCNEPVLKREEKLDNVIYVNNSIGSQNIQVKTPVKPLKAGHNKNNHLCCPLCGIICDGTAALRRHQCEPRRKQQQSSKDSLICEICGHSYASVATLLVHHVQQHRVARFQCDRCHRSFGFRCILEKHIRSEHELERMPCNLCGKTFKYAQDLKVHMQHHDDPRPFKCDQCDSTFRFPGALRSHKILHQKEHPFKCDVCGKDFRYENSLRVHKRLHTGVKKFKCDVCEREFSTKAPMLRHMKVHESGREMACVVCGLVYYKKVDLEIHQSKKHPDHASVGKVKPILRCDKCGKEFTKKSNLKAHSYTHEEVYRFPCKQCSQSFKQRAGLLNHTTVYHRETIVPATAGS
ncbi:zinc finger protein 62 homolog [Anopheles moucheti]|uniref:zinc finger protein 62 homolog n=1 Tax=Anopheles moucheti TaxID=186751 RepID=UPI0022EFFF13|nr:zinc finger protein 62 homolog [Anopheles moucheti]